MVRTVTDVFILTLGAEGNIEIYKDFKKLYASPILAEVEEVEEWLRELEI